MLGTTGGLMRKATLALLLLLIPASSLFAQDWRDRRYRPSSDYKFDITAFGGYRWGGTIYSDQTNLYGQNVDLRSSGSYGASLGIPITSGGTKIELLVDRQDTNVGHAKGLFSPEGDLGKFHVTYYHAGLLLPFAQSRTASPYLVVSAGIANLDPVTQGVSASNKFSAAAGVGVNVPVNPSVAFRVEVRGFYTSTGNNSRCDHCYYNFDTNYHDFSQGEAKVGLSIRF